MKACSDSNTGPSRVARATALVLLLCAPALPLFAQADRAPLVSGTYRTLHSTVLGEDRALIVGVPADYERSERTYTVLYRLDGDAVTYLHTVAATAYLVDMREQKTDYIVVAIQNTDRRRDMDPEGGADRFIRFIKTELVPDIERSYRTNGTRVLAGQSFSALFAFYAFLKEPGLFDAYLLGSFGLYKPELSGVFEEALKTAVDVAKVGRRAIFVGNARQDSYDPDGSKTKRGADILAALAQRAPVEVKTAVYDDGHVPFPFVYDGLAWLAARQAAAAKK